MSYDLTYNGTQLTWPGQNAVYNATSGMNHPDEGNWQNAKNQCVSDAGPIPEGIYRFSALIASKGPKVTMDSCTIHGAYGSGIETIPRGKAAGGCEEYWMNWGNNRVRLEAYDSQATKACHGQRGGFYLHDSTKGFTHGCIEVDPKFFMQLRTYAQSKVKGKKSHLLLKVDYPSKSSSTFGNTKKP